MNKYFKQKIISLIVVLVIMLLITYLNQLSLGENKKDLFVYYLDVGQGDSVLIKTPNGMKVLIDAGRDGKVINEIEKILPFYDKRIDLIIFSHGDLDHIGGFYEVLDRYSVGQVIRSKIEVDSDIEKNLLEKVKSLGIEIEEIQKGDKIVLDQNAGIYLETYWPLLRQGYEGQAIESSDRNENSLVLELIHGENEFLFTGDATIESELELLKIFETQIDSDVLKVGHHGSKTSTSQMFLDKVTPDYSILSYGENSYGHPHKEVTDRLTQSGIKTFETKKRTIVVRSNAETLEVYYSKSLFNQTSFLQSLISAIFVNGFDSSS
jgi:competence protein ComEC